MASVSGLQVLDGEGRKVWVVSDSSYDVASCHRQAPDTKSSPLCSFELWTNRNLSLSYFGLFICHNKGKINNAMCILEKSAFLLFQINLLRNFRASLIFPSSTQYVQHSTNSFLFKYLDLWLYFWLNDHTPMIPANQKLEKLQI